MMRLGRVVNSQDTLDISSPVQRVKILCMVSPEVVLLQESLKPFAPGALFKVKFHFAKFSFDINRRLSLIPIPFIIANPDLYLKHGSLEPKQVAFTGVTSGSLLMQPKIMLIRFHLN